MTGTCKRSFVILSVLITKSWIDFILNHKQVGAVVLIILGVVGLAGKFDNFGEDVDFEEQFKQVLIYIILAEGCVMVVVGGIGCCALLSQNGCVCVLVSQQKIVGLFFRASSLKR